MNRQFAGLSVTRQLAYAQEYATRFGAHVVLGQTPADPVTVSGVPAFHALDHETAEALRELDARCHAEWMARP